MWKMNKIKEFEFFVRQSLEDKKYILCVLINKELFDIWGFNNLSNLLQVKALIEADLN